MAKKPFWGTMKSEVFRQQRSGPQLRTTASVKRTYSAVNYQATLYPQLKLLNLPQPVEEHVFHPERKWRFDFAWVKEKIALEIEGGIWTPHLEEHQRAHTGPANFLKDMKKYNEAALLGWCVLRVTPEMVPQEDGRALQLIERAFQREEKS